MTPITPIPPVLILQPQANDGPAYLGTWLSERGVAFEVCSVEAGCIVPLEARRYRAIAMLGGAMSVNDDLHFLRRAEQLLRDAVAHGVPVIGHCLGGQMLARALDAPTTDNPVPEIGWSRVTPVDHPLAQAWLGEAAEGSIFPAFQWHYQTFALPAGATRIAGNATCANQAFAIGPHLGMQFHIEVDDEKLDRWAVDAAAEAQDEAAIRADTARFLRTSQQVADRIYTRWLALTA